MAQAACFLILWIATVIIKDRIPDDAYNILFAFGIFSILVSLGKVHQLLTDTRTAINAGNLAASRQTDSE